MPKFEITMSKVYSIVITREFASEEEAEEFAANYSWGIEDAGDMEDGEAVILELGD